MNTPRKMAFTGAKEGSQSRYKTTCLLIILILFSVFRVLSILSRYSFSQSKHLFKSIPHKTTFYSHYNNISKVLDSLLDDALEIASEHTSADAPLPVCQRLTELPEYRVLFRDPVLKFVVCYFLLSLP